jgi:hypothetical protein
MFPSLVQNLHRHDVSLINVGIMEMACLQMALLSLTHSSDTPPLFGQSRLSLHSLKLRSTSLRHAEEACSSPDATNYGN